MRTKFVPHSVAAFLFMVFTLLVLLATGVFTSAETAPEPAAPAVPCPSPTKSHVAGGCVLDKDETLTRTLRLPPNTKLNCKGHKLLPTDIGSDLTDRSTPSVGIFLDHAEGVLIQNCVIDGFDFGVFAINNKVRPVVRANPQALAQRRNNISGNTINARFMAIGLAKFDNTEIKNNAIKYTTAGGKGIYVGRDSDINSVTRNEITADIALANSPALGAPGPLNASTNPSVSAGQAALITQTLGPDPTLLNAIIDETDLFQLPISKSATSNENFSEDNRFEDNVIVFTREPSEGVVISIAQRTKVRHNSVRAATNSIRTGIQSGANGVSKTFPGKCTAPVGRSCLVDADCNILGTTAATCSEPAPSNLSVFWVTERTVIEGNIVTGPFLTGISTNGTNTMIRGNTIIGPLRPLGTGAITLIARFGLGPTTTVTRNVVTDVATVLDFRNNIAQLQNMSASEFRASISLNDFTCYTTSVRTDIAATLSVPGQGNFWGFPCFQVFDRSKVLGVNLPNAGDLVTDEHPFETTVAKLFDLPEPCR